MGLHFNCLTLTAAIISFSICPSNCKPKGEFTVLKKSEIGNITAQGSEKLCFGLDYNDFVSLHTNCYHQSTCYTTCMMQGLKMITDEGTFNREQFALISQTSDPFVTNMLFTILNYCADQIEAFYGPSQACDCDATKDLTMCLDRFVRAIPDFPKHVSQFEYCFA